MKKRSELLRRQPLAVDLGVHQRRGDVVARVGPTVLAELLGVHEHLHQHAHQLLERADVLGVADTEDHVGPLKDLGFVLGRDAHHLADDLEGERCGDLLDEVAFAIRELLDQPIDDRGRLRADVSLDLGDLPRREPLGDDAAQAEVARVVHGDHRADELVHLLGNVADVDAAAADEHLRVAAGGPHVVVAGDGPVAGALRQRAALVQPLVEEDEFVSVPQCPERGMPVVARRDPELRVAEIECAQVQHRRPCGRAYRCNAFRVGS